MNFEKMQEQLNKSLRNKKLRNKNSIEHIESSAPLMVVEEPIISTGLAEQGMDIKEIINCLAIEYHTILLPALIGNDIYMSKYAVPTIKLALKEINKQLAIMDVAEESINSETLFNCYVKFRLLNLISNKLVNTEDPFSWI